MALIIFSLSTISLLAIFMWWAREILHWNSKRVFEKEYLSALRGAIFALLKTRDGVRLEIPREMVGATSPGPTGKIYLPPKHPMPDGDRENLLEMVQGRLGSEAIDGRFNMEGAHPYLELHVPAQPPSIVSWETAIGDADPENPLLGYSAGGCVRWDLHMESPHLVIAGGSGSGKSELIAFAVAQLMRGGAGTIVLDPKYSSHLWLFRRPGVLYCSEAQMIHDTIMWLDEELRSRGRASREPGYVMPRRIVVMIEERNSLQTLLRELWAEIREPSMPRTSPAMAAMDRLSSQGRSLGIHILLAGQETAERYIGSRANFGAFAVAGRMPVAKWKLTGAARKPAISSKPGRFGYVVAGEVTVFQAAYPDLKHRAERLLQWAFDGDVWPLDVQEMMMTTTIDTHTFPSSEASSSTITEFIVSLPKDEQKGARDWLNNQKRRHPERFPEVIGQEGTSDTYDAAELTAYWENWRPRVDAYPVHS